MRTLLEPFFYILLSSVNSNDRDGGEGDENRFARTNHVELAASHIILKDDLPSQYVVNRSISSQVSVINSCIRFRCVAR